jgi:hypothetical protein
MLENQTVKTVGLLGSQYWYCYLDDAHCWDKRINWAGNGIIKMQTCLVSCNHFFAAVLAFIFTDHSSCTLWPIGMTTSTLFQIKCSSIGRLGHKGSFEVYYDCESLNFQSTTKDLIIWNIFGLIALYGLEIYPILVTSSLQATMYPKKRSNDKFLRHFIWLWWEDWSFCFVHLRTTLEIDHNGIKFWLVHHPPTQFT